MEVTKDMVRKAMRALGANDHEVSYRQVYEALGLTNDSQQAIVRTRISGMLRHGEVKRLRAGVFAYNAKYRRAEGRKYVAMWCYARTSKPGWTLKDCCMLTRVSYTHVMRYIGWLESEGFVERVGRDANRAYLYRATGKADASPETPYPPVRETDPFQRERVAAATITRLMLCADPYAPKTAQTIVESCRVLLARFEKGGADSVTKNENEEHTTEEVC